MFSSIVVGTDGSATAQEAVRVAAEMARRFGAHLHVLSAYRLFGDMVVVAPALEEKVLGAEGAEEGVRAEIEARLGAVAEEVERDGVAVTTHLAAGNPAEAILDVALRHHADLIVVGNRGVGNRMLGSVPNNVVQHAPCSVLVVHTWPRPDR
jgi:nucleotide-binding universal stress UspA family protein